MPITKEPSPAAMKAWIAGEARALARFPALAANLSRPVVPFEERLQAAERLRERLGSVPFYAKRAARAAAEGDEMAYWLSLQATQATAHRNRESAASGPAT